MLNAGTTTASIESESPDARTTPSRAVRGPRVAKRALTALAVVLTALSGLMMFGGGVADAASVPQPANCNVNYSSGARSLVVRAPKVWSNNGRAQSVRYRSVLYKWNGSTWGQTAIGQWHYGTAYPNTAWQDSPSTWGLNAYGRGAYYVNVQTQYLTSAWGGTQTAGINTYYNMAYYSGSWSLTGTNWYCAA